MKKIALIGCGNIGSRHLQALVKSSFDCEITIVEPNSNAKKLAESRLNEIDFKKSNFNISWKTTIDDIFQNDLVIIATHSSNRIELIEKLLSMDNSKFLIEKMVCQSSDEYDQILTMFDSKKAKGWTNTSRRYIKSYKKIKNLINPSSKLNVIIHSGNIGLGSNAIHFIDLFSWLINDKNISLDGKYLDEKIWSNKRDEDLKEFSGTIIGNSSDGSNISITFQQEENLPLFVNIFNNDFSFVIDEVNEKIYDLREQKIDDFKMDFVSNLTTKITDDIINTNSCLLPTLAETKIAHDEIFKIFNLHILKITHKEVEKCPIT